ncbi:hypothetical protein [Ramlibacter pinisoli]|uniref:hypothetical protein n=1 Tax=Ramlibacter sp. CGMCC 1.13660 TaxID=2755558 RepID=UPI002103DC4C|nr:hypothetical protein [Ramlibacter sp. CGMCC 1.13660]
MLASILSRRCVPLASLLLGACLSAVHAADGGPSGHEGEEPWKLTTGVYAVSGGGQQSAQALDVNLRRSGSFGNGWIGWYRQNSDGLTQWRAGWDRFFAAGPARIQPALQVASGGFFGATVSVEAGQPWFAGVGAGRTNLRPYVNLNFDPNDMVMASFGHRSDHDQVQLLLIADNRQHPDQRHLHLNWKTDRDGGEKLTWDILAKQGDVDGEHIRRVGASVTYDWPRWSLRAAWDPKVNFTPQNMLRLSVASRF